MGLNQQEKSVSEINEPRRRPRVGRRSIRAARREVAKYIQSLQGSAVVPDPRAFPSPSKGISRSTSPRLQSFEEVGAIDAVDFFKDEAIRLLTVIKDPVRLGEFESSRHRSPFDDLENAVLNLSMALNKMGINGSNKSMVRSKSAAEIVYIVCLLALVENRYTNFVASYENKQYEFKDVNGAQLICEIISNVQGRATKEADLGYDAA